MIHDLDGALSTKALSHPNLSRSGVISLQTKLRGVSCRLIEAADLEAIINLLTEGFPNPRSYWIAALAVLKSRSVPDGMPRYGYLLECDREPVGVLLLIAAILPGDLAAEVRLNSSSWYVRPAFRTYASILVSRALRGPGTTYLNISAARHTWPILTAQGYNRFVNGALIAIPALKPSWGPTQILEVTRLTEAHQTIPGAERDLLMDHARAGAIAFWCESKAGGSPFVFRSRKIILRRLPCSQLIYCRGLEEFVQMAGPIGRFLMRRGMPFVLIGTNGPISGLFGIYLDARYPMFVRGGTGPRMGDLAYTEAGLFGL